jgi:hypothetical protein
MSLNFNRQNYKNKEKSDHQQQIIYDENSKIDGDDNEIQDLF